MNKWYINLITTSIILYIQYHYSYAKIINTVSTYNQTEVLYSILMTTCCGLLELKLVFIMAYCSKIPVFNNNVVV